MKNQITFQSYGGGQDSWAILLKLTNDKEFRKKYAPGKLVVAMVDTKNEHKETYESLNDAVRVCRENNIPFFLLDPKDGYHTKAWGGGLLEFYRKYNAIGSKCFPKQCSEQLKIRPFWKWVDSFLHKNYKVGKKNKNGDLKKTALKEFVKLNGKVNVLIGIGREEETRVKKSIKEPLWFQNSVNKVYPLLEEGMNRQDCQDYAISVGEEVPIPSNCIVCPYMNEVELLYLYRLHNDSYEEWVDLEAAKIKAHAYNGDPTKTMNSKGEIVDNMGVWGKMLLPEKMEEIHQKYGHMTNDQLREYRMSHGHCVKSSY